MIAVSFKRTAGWLWGVCVVIMLTQPALQTMGQSMNDGLWLRPGGDAANTGRATREAKLASPPVEVWRTGHVQRRPDDVRLLGLTDASTLLQVVNGGLMKSTVSTGESLWPRPLIGVTRILVEAPANRVLVVRGDDELLLVDLADGAMVWQWHAPSPAHGLGAWKDATVDGRLRLFVFPSGTTRGFAFEFAADCDAPATLWQKDYAPRFHANFGPSIVLADMDRDGEEEIVLAGKPAYVGVISQRTGEVKFDLAYPVDGAPEDVGRPYGLFQTEDLDGNGFLDVVMVSCQVEEYAAVLRNVGGSALALQWSRFVEKDFPTDDREIRPNLHSLSDVNGNGRRELVIGVFNRLDDMQWRTLVLDTAAGIDQPLYDWPNRYFRDCVDITGDGVAEVIVEVRRERLGTARTTLEARCGVTGEVVATLEHASVAKPPAVPHRLPRHQAFMATMNPLLTIPTGNGCHAILVDVEIDGVVQRAAWSAPGGRSRTEPFASGSLSWLLLAAGKPADAPTLSLDFNLPAFEAAASAPMVCQDRDRRELVVTRSDGVIIGGRPDLDSSDQWHDAWSIPGRQAAAWQTSPDRRLLVVATDEKQIDVYQPTPSHELKDETSENRSPAIFSIHLPACLAANATAFLPYGSDGHARVWLTMRPGVHKSASAIYDDQGKLIFEDPEYAPYPSVAAAGRLFGDKNDHEHPSVVIDDHGKQFIYDGAGHASLIAEAWHQTVPGRGDGSAYAMPIIGPFGDAGETGIVMAPGLMAIEVLTPTGQRLSRWPFASPYIFGKTGAAVAKLRGDARWDLCTVRDDGLLFCLALPTLHQRWTLNLDTRLYGKAAIIAGRIAARDSGDDSHITYGGGDALIVGLPDGRVMAVPESGDQGRVLWQFTLSAPIDELALADVDDDGVCELIVTTRDGLVRIFR